MKEKILQLRSEGKSYSEIQKELNCSRGTISYHCGKGQKEKTNIRRKSHLSSYPLAKKIYRFRHAKNNEINKGPLKRSSKKLFSDKVRDFQRRYVDNSKLGKAQKLFNQNDVIN